MSLEVQIFGPEGWSSLGLSTDAWYPKSVGVQTSRGINRDTLIDIPLMVRCKRKIDGWWSNNAEKKCSDVQNSEVIPPMTRCKRNIDGWWSNNADEKCSDVQNSEVIPQMARCKRNIDGWWSNDEEKKCSDVQNSEVIPKMARCKRNIDGWWSNDVEKSVQMYKIQRLYLKWHDVKETWTIDGPTM